MGDKVVLKEEVYLNEMGKIIERDFFPILHEHPKVVDNLKPPKPLSLNQFLNKYHNEENVLFTKKLAEEREKNILRLKKMFGSRCKAIESGTNLFSNSFGLVNYKGALRASPKIQYASTRLNNFQAENISAFALKNMNECPKRYAFVRTPAPVPDLTCTPLITWGKMESTPIPADGDETISSFQKTNRTPNIAEF